MNRQTAEKRVEKLKVQINEYRYRYHVLDDPSISDEVYDSLTKELKTLEAKFPDLLTPDSPTQRVGGKPLAKFTSVQHLRPMLSLNDAFSEEELAAWDGRIQKLLPKTKHDYHLDLKMDGLAAALIYEGGVLVRALTRGDGYTGEDVTLNVRTIHTVPLRLRHYKGLDERLFNGRVEVRGEILMHKKAFDALNKERAEAGLPVYANPRNTAAGSVRQLDPKLTATRPLRFHAYRLYTEPRLETLNAEYETASKLGFVVNKDHTVVKNLEQAKAFIKKWDKARQKLLFNTDGVVVTINQNELFENLGVVGKAPRGAVAFKYPAEQATTKIKDIMVSIGRTGAATPFAVMEPVQIAGSTVQMATLHNENEVKRKDIRIGDTVVLQKAGDIIPEVVEPLPKLRTGKEKRFVMPKICPVCDTPLHKDKAEEAIWRCPNKLCPARQRGGIVHYASKGALDIEGLGEKVAEVLLREGLVSDIADLYALKKSELIKLERFADISAQNLLDSIADKKQVPLDRFLFGLGIRHIGRQTAIDLSHKFGQLNKLQQASLEELEAVEGIGSVVAHSLYVWLNEPEHKELLKKLQRFGVEPRPVKSGGKLAGKAIVITGTLESMSRDDAAERIRGLGGKFQNSVGKDTDYLVVAESPGASKVNDAAKYQTKQITEKQLLALIR